MKPGDLVHFNEQPGFVFGPDEYGIGLILEVDRSGLIDDIIVWCPEYIHGPVEFEHEEIDLLLVSRESK